jgi:putative heme iron utilization protein
MPEQIPTAERIALIDRYVTELVLLTKEQCPDAVVEVLFTHYEDEDAHILVFVPEETEEIAVDRLQAVLTERSVQMLDGTGVLILAGVYEASQRRW